MFPNFLIDVRFLIASLDSRLTTLVIGKIITVDGRSTLLITSEYESSNIIISDSFVVVEGV
jgi:hypothetical protein